MRSSSLATLGVLSVALSVLAPAAAFGQFSITNYQFVSEQRVTLTSSAVTYRADLVDPAGAVPGVTAKVSTLDPFTVRTIPGQDTLQFAPVPANSQVTSNNTFTILVDRTLPFNFNKLSWTFQVNNQPPPVANAGPNQMASVGSKVTLDGSASTNPSGIGTLSYSWMFTALPTGSSAFLQRSTTVMPSFVIDVPGTYVILLTVSNGGASSTASVMVSTSCAPPVANAGPDQTVAPGATVVLNGGASTSPCGNPLTYAWTLISVPVGSVATLSAANIVSPTFVADKPGVYKAQLIVNDGANNSAPSVVTITQLVKPVANAGPGQLVAIGSLVQLNGAGSTDANGLPLTYQWIFTTLPAGSAAVLSNPAAVNPTFTADRTGPYVVQLIVNNGALNSDPSTVTISTQQPPAPTANAGPNQTVPVGSPVQLNGSGTDPLNLPLTFQWALINKPAGSAANLSSTQIPNPTFVADLPGPYIAQLVVTNSGGVSSAPSTVTINTTCSQPTANPGPNQNVGVGATVMLNGSGSGDACRDPLTYAWSFTTRPPGSNATLSGANTATPTFVADVAGPYVVQLIVNNGFSNSNPATVTINAANDIILPSNVRIVIGQQADFPVALTNPAASGGVFITLSSSDTTTVTISPTSLFIGQGQTMPSRPPTVTGINNGSALITATATGLATASQVVIVGTGPTLSFSGSPLALFVGATGNLTLMLSAPAPAGGLTVNLSSSNPAAATVPATVMFAPGANSVPVAATGVGVGSTTITASAPGTSATATVNVTQISIGVPATTTLNLGQSAPFAVTLSAAAPAAVTVCLISSDTTKVTVSPACVNIVAGATTPAVQPQVTAAGIGSATITASAANYTSGTGTVTVTPPTLNFTGSPLSVTAGNTGTLTLNLAGGVAPAGGFIVNLSSSDPSKATVPPTVTIPAGATSAPVTVTGVAQGSTIITASAPGIAVNATATVNVVSLLITVPPTTSVNLGGTAPFTVTLSQAAPAGGVIVTLSSSDTTKVTVPATVSILAGATTPAVQPLVTGAGIGSATITASAPGYTSGTGTVTVPCPTLSFTGSPLSVTVSNTGTLTLNLAGGVAPAGGLTVNLSSSNPALATVPGTVIIPAGASSAPVTVTGVAQGGPVTITASLPCTSAIATVNVVNLLINVPATTSVGLGASVPFNVSLSQAATSPVTVNLSSSDTTKVTVSPASVSIAAGATTPVVQPTVTGTGFGSATITASAPGSGYLPGTGTVTVSTPVISFAGSPLALTVGTTGNLTLNLAGPALGSDLTINLSSGNTAAATVPPTVIIPAGSNSAPVTVTGVGAGSATITATVPGTSSMATATVNVTQISINVASISVGLGQTASLAVTLSAPAPAAVTVNLNNSDPTKVTLSAASVSIAAGATAPATQPSATGVGIGPSTITGSATNLASGMGTVTVTPPTLSFSPTSLTIIAGNTGTLVLNLAGGQAPAGGFTVNLSSSNPAFATVPPTVNFAAGATSASVTVTAVAPGSATISAGAPGIPTNATAGITVVSPPSIGVPPGTSLNLGGSATFTVTLSAAATSPVTVNLSSSDTSKVTVSPASVSIAVGATTPLVQPTVTGAGVGAATITASATGYTPGLGSVSVSAPTMNFSEANTGLQIQQGNSGNLTLNLRGGVAPPGGFTVSLMSNDPSTASVPATATFAAGASSVLVPVMGVKTGGPVTITASAPGISPATAPVTVTPPPPPMLISVASASVGQNLQAPILISISPAAPGNGLPLTVTSSDPTKVLVAALPTDAGSPQVNISIGQGLTLQRVYAQALVNSGTVTITVSAPGSGYQNGQGTITLTPSGFIMSASGASSFSTPVGAASPTTLTLNAARLDASLNFAEIQQVRGGTTAAVPIGNSNPNVGTVASPVQFGGGADTATTTFTPTANNANAGTTVLTAQAPPGFATPNSGNSVTATVQQAMIVCNGGNAVGVGKNLQTTVSCTLNGGSATPGLQVTFASNDSTKLQFAPLPANSMSCTAAGTGVLTLTTVAPPLGPPVIPVFCVYGLASGGNITYSISASGFIPGTGSVTLGPSGVVISGPGGVGAPSFVAFGADTPINVFSALLDGAGNYVTAQPVAGGFSATVNVTSSNPAVGTITTSPLTIPAASTSASTNFHVTPGASGNSDITVSTAPGFGTPALQFTKVTAQVLLQKFFLSCGGITIGRNLEANCSVSIASPAPSLIMVTLTSANPALLLLSSSATTAGLGSISVMIPAGATSATYFAQALGSSGTVTHKASSPGSGITDSDPASVTLAPSGAVLSGLPFIFTNVGAGPTPVTVALTVLNADNSSAGNFQPLRGGLAPVSISLNSSSPGVGTITSPVTISAGFSNATAQFSPVSPGTTIVSVLPVAGFTTPTTNTSLMASVSP